MGKDGWAVLQGYGYIAPTALSYFMLARNPWPPLCADHGLRIWRTEGAWFIVSYTDAFANSFLGYKSFSNIFEVQIIRLNEWRSPFQG